MSGEKNAPETGPELRVILPLCIAGFSGLLNVGVLGPFVAIVAADLDVSVPRVGYTATAALIMTSFSGLIVGWLADNGGFRRVLVSGLGLLAASGLLVAISTTYALFLGARVLGAVGFAAATGLPNAIVSTQYRGEARQRALGYVSAASVLAGLVGPPVLTFAGDLTSWRVAFALVGGLALLAGAGVRMSIPAPETPSQPPPSLREGFDSYLTLLTNPAMRLIYVATLLQMAGLIGAIVYVGAYLTDEIGLSVRYVGFAFASQSLGGLAAGLLAGRIPEDRTVSRYMLAMLGLAVAVAGIYLFTPSFAVVLLLVMLAGFSQVIAWVLLVGLLARNTPVGQGSTMVFNGSVLGAGGAMGTALGGVIIGALGYAWLGVVFALIALGSGLAIWLAARCIQAVSN